MKSKLLNDDKQKTFAIILDSGDEVMESILSFAKEEKLHAAQFNAIGAFSKVTLGYFDFSIKDYKENEVNEQVEVCTLAGDVSLYKDEHKVHAHVVVGKKGWYCLWRPCIKSHCPSNVRNNPYRITPHI